MATLDIRAYIGKQYFGRIGLEGVNSIFWLRRQTRWLAFVDKVINILVPQTDAELFGRTEIVSF